MKHGLSSYKNGKCKCKVCRKANNDYQQNQRKTRGRAFTDSSLTQRQTN